MSFLNLVLTTKTIRFQEIIPCTYRCMNEGTRILVAGLFDFASAVFPDFQKLPSDDKVSFFTVLSRYKSITFQWLLIRNYQQIFHCIDGELRALQRFGQESFLWADSSFNDEFATFQHLRFLHDLPFGRICREILYRLPRPEQFGNCCEVCPHF